MMSNTPQEALDRINECKKEKSTSLDLGGCGLSSIPKEIAELTWLTELWLGTNQISKMEGIDTLANLTKLSLGNNQISKMQGIDTLENLTYLELGYNQISKIEGIDTLVNLTDLSLQNNQISKIEGIEKLVNLTELSLGYNQISKIEGVDTLVNLRYLGLSGNQISKIEGIEKLENLTLLRLNRNQISKIEGIDTLVNLTRLWLGNNQIYDLSPLVYFIKMGLSLKWSDDYSESTNSILIKNNPLQIPDIETVMRGNEAVIAYFEEKAKLNTKKKEYEGIPSVKMILFGNSGVGKTNLSKYLRGEYKDDNRDSTHGILIDNWTNEDDNLLVNIWDFGGQEYYHGSYRLFMSNKVVFVVLWDSESNQNKVEKDAIINEKTGEKEDLTHFEFQYWLDNIAHYAPEAPIFLIQNKTDIAGKQRHLPAHFDNYEIIDDYAISLKKGSQPNNVKEHRQLSNFITELKEELKKHTYNDNDKAEYRLKLRDYLLDLQEDTSESNNPFLPFKENISIAKSDFEKIMIKVAEDFGAKYLEDVLDWLHTRGTVLYYKDNAALNSYVFLQPKKITTLIYGILNKDILEKEGKFSLPSIDVQEITPEIAIALMLQMEIVFKVPNIKNENEYEYIAPQYLPEKHALQDLYDIASEEIQSIAYSVKLPLFYYRRVLQQLILHYGKNQDIGSKSYFWKHGILIKKDGIRLLIKGLYPNENENEGIVSVATDRKEGYLKLQRAIFRAIYIICKGDEKVEIEINDAAYDAEKHTSSYKEEQMETNSRNPKNISKQEEKLNYRIEVSTDSIHFIPYSDLLAKTKEDPTLRKIEAKSKDGKTKQLIINDFAPMLDKVPERPLKVFISYAHRDLKFMDDLNTHLRTLRRSQLIETWNDRAIIAGQEWDDTILGELRSADVVIMMMSAYFIDSDYIWEKEVKIALENKAKGKLVLPIYTKPFDFSGLTWKPAKETLEEGDNAEQVLEGYNLTKIQWIPFNQNRQLQAISTWDDRELAFTAVAKEIRKAIETYKPQVL
jgi:internalin A